MNNLPLRNINRGHYFAVGDPRSLDYKRRLQRPQVHMGGDNKQQSGQRGH